MPTRREVLKGGGGAVLAGAAGWFGRGTAAHAATPDHDVEPRAASSATRSATARAFRPGGAGPLYWSTYGYENSTNTMIPEHVWKANVDWVADTFRDDGYTMVCTDGWIDNTQRTTKHGYILSQADDWEHDWAWWAKYLERKGLGLGVYYNPLWATNSAVDDPTVTVVGRPDIKVADIVNPGDDFGGLLHWIDTNRDGAKEYVQGYVDYFRRLGAVFFRIDFLAWYENGYDQNEGTVAVAHGREAYVRALEWISEAAGDMQLSLVMPNLFDHGSAERRYGDLIRIDNDASFGSWYNLSGGRETWQPEWSQWNNPFLGFTGFADISGRGQAILDGDPLIIRSFQNDAERQSAISLFTIAGAPIAITDRVDTIKGSANIFKNQEVLALRKAGLVGKPVFHNGHAFEYDGSSRDPERWIGQLPDGRWAVALFNRADGTRARTKSIDFAAALGITGPAAVRDLWRHEDLGSMTHFEVDLKPHTSVLLLVTPRGKAQFQADVGAWAGSARFENTFGGHTGMGYVTGLDTEGSSVGVGISVADAGTHRLKFRVANATGHSSSLTVRTLDPVTGAAHGQATLDVPTTRAWTSWQDRPVALKMAAGTNLVVCGVDDSDHGAVNLDSITVL
ncbi:MAG TPA: carbohydrate-binding protein [Acidimicrobiia bacterium]|jgi:alpha-glucosidase|nr:carbohydrate-binding protein [Acidimicrobiia bacterium]